MTDTEWMPQRTRRARTFLEADVQYITDKIVTGELVLRGATPHYIGQAIQAELGLEEAPSTGAVRLVLKRWVEMGFINVTVKPYAFESYTDDAVEYGLVALRARLAVTRRQARDADRAIEAA